MSVAIETLQNFLFNHNEYHVTNKWIEQCQKLHDEQGACQQVEQMIKKIELGIDAIRHGKYIYPNVTLADLRNM